jgi:hypothetical protein
MRKAMSVSFIMRDLHLPGLPPGLALRRVVGALALANGTPSVALMTASAAVWQRVRVHRHRIAS